MCLFSATTWSGENERFLCYKRTGVELDNTLVKLTYEEGEVTDRGGLFEDIRVFK